jgi:hypothetical protein
MIFEFKKVQSMSVLFFGLSLESQRQLKKELVLIICGMAADFPFKLRVPVFKGKYVKFGK